MLAACGGGSAVGPAPSSTGGESNTGGTATTGGENSGSGTETNSGTGTGTAGSGTGTGTGSGSGSGTPVDPTTPEADPVMRASARSTGYTGEYSTVTSGPYLAINNNWNENWACLDAPGGSQQVFVSDARRDGSVDFRVSWDFTCLSNKLIGYPELTYGVPSSPAYAAAPGGKLPMRLGQVKTLKTSYAGIEGQADGGGYMAYDLWTSTSPDGSLVRASRDAEVLIVLHPLHGFGVPQNPPEALVGRENQTERNGWDPKGYTAPGAGRKTIGGREYDVYYYPPGMHADAKFIALLPVQYPMASALTVDWRPLLDYFMAQGWLSPDVYLANVELGVENYSFTDYIQPTGISKGDWTVRRFKVDIE